MNAAQLLDDLRQLGIRLESDGDKLRFFPRSKATPELVEQMKSHKAELLAILDDGPGETEINIFDAGAVWQAIIDRVETDPDFPPDLIEALRNGSAQWARQD